MRYTSPTGTPVALTVGTQTLTVGPGLTELPAHFDAAAVEAGLLDETGKVSKLAKPEPAEKPEAPDRSPAKMKRK